MIKRYNILRISKEDEDSLELIDWIWNSHYWIEYSPGYCKCKWCGAQHTSEMGMNLNYPICSKNPAILARDKGDM